MTTGMRPGEYLALKWKDVNLDEGTIYVTRTISRRKARWHFDETKTAESWRKIKIAPPVAQALRAHKSGQAAERLKAGIGYRDFDLVFASLNGEPVDCDRLRSLYFKPLLEKESCRRPSAFTTCGTRARRCCLRQGNTRRSYPRCSGMRAYN